MTEEPWDDLTSDESRDEIGEAISELADLLKGALRDFGRVAEETEKLGSQMAELRGVLAELRGLLQ